MIYTIHDCPQRSPEWYAVRLGRLTASDAGDAIATIKSGEAATRRNLRTRLLLERLTGRQLDSGFTTKAMQQGIEREPLARAVYEAMTGDLVTEVGFVSGADLMVGCSPDGILQNQAGFITRVVEFKCPEPTAHLTYWRDRKMGAAYEAQVLHALWVTGAERCDWMSYNPDFPEPMQTVLITVERDDAAVDAYAEKALAFLDDLDSDERDVRERMAAA